MKFINSKFGFSLIEVVVGLAILGVIGGLVAGILSRTYKGSNKAGLIGSIKQNGQGALNNIDSSIRNADSVVCPDTAAPSTVLVIQNKSGYYFRFRFIPQPADKSSNGYIEEDQLTLPDPSQASALCSATSNTPFSLSDQNTQTGISLITGTFQVNKVRGAKDVVTISFDMAPGVASGSGFDTTLGGSSINFKTSVQLR